MRFAILLCTLTASLAMHAAAQGAIAPGRLRCEYRNNPQGIDEAAPRLSWIVTSVNAGQEVQR